MGFKRIWDSSCPRVWDSWEENGTKWVIQDLDPQDDEKAVEILREHLVPDETLCALSNVYEDPKSVQSLTNFWRECLAKRMTLACYKEVDGKKTPIALNVCVVNTADDKFPHIDVSNVATGKKLSFSVMYYCQTNGEALKNVYDAVMYIENKCDSFGHLGYDVLLGAFGLTVKKEYRGENLGSRLLLAREPLSLAHGVKATSTVFTGPASQKSAERSGFKSICEVSLKELSENGMNYPPDEDRVIKLMVKSFV